MYLLFTTNEHTKLFALSKLHEQDAAKSIETVMDSSRYFVTKITSNSKTARIGFGFRDRDVAIDLLGNLQQFQKSIARELQAKNLKVAEIPKLAAGEKIHIQFGKSGGTKPRKSTSKASSSSGTPLLLKKPPKATSEEPTTVQVRMETQTGATGEDDDDDNDEKDQDIHKVLSADHKSVASEDSNVAQANKSIAALDFGDDDADEWDDFQSA